MPTPTIREVQPASTAMNTLASIKKQFLDNANAGKLVTDVGPGLALTVPLLMLVAILTQSELVPAQQVPLLRKQYREVYAGADYTAAKLTAVTDGDPLTQDTYSALKRAPKPARKSKSTASPQAPLPNRWTEAESNATASLDALTAELTTARRNLNDAPSAPNFARVELLAANQKQIQTALAQLAAQRAQLAELRKNYTDASTVTKNLEIWEANIVLVAGAAVVLGVIISQAARLIFFELFFALIARAQRARRYRRTSGASLQALKVDDKTADKQRAMTTILKQRSPAFAAAYQDLVTHHLRYAEGAVNMAIPVLVFGFIYPKFAETFSDSPPHAFSVLVWSLIIGLSMIGSGCVTYLRFREKERAWLKQNLDNVAISQAAIDATAAEKNSAASAKKAEEFAAAAKATVTSLQKTVDDHTEEIAKLKKP